MCWTIIHTRAKTNAALSKPKKRLVLYDGECLMCNGYIRGILSRADDTLRAAALQHYPLDDNLPAIDSSIDSMVLIEDGHVYYRTDAVLRLNAAYGRVGWLSRLALLVPSVVRNGAYNFIAKRRYKWFGKSDNCLLPPPALRNKYLHTPATMKEYLSE